MGTDAALQCRICATDLAVNGAVHIFAEEGRRHCLQAYIRKYLYILVSFEDKLPKMVCVTCIKRLENIHRFALMALRTQDKLKQKLNGENIESKHDQEEKGNKDIQNAMKKIEDRGLLHSILTKGSTEAPTEHNVESSEVAHREEKLHTPKMEEMEVKIDPMLFLQYGLDQPSSEFSEVSDSEEKIIKSEPNQHTNKYSEEDELEDKDTDEKEMEDKQEGIEECSDEDVSDTSMKAHKCTICSASFFSQIGLQNHLWSHLPRDRKIDEKSVLRSQQVYSSNGVLQSNGDNSTGNFICPICSKKISTKGNLKVHLETHRPKGKYGCDICGRIFKTQSNLYRHKEYHGGIQFPCNVCGRVYPTNSTLRAHSITHSDLRPHACPLCDKTFKRNQDLKFHINQHTGARPYQCPYCPKAFASSGNCFSHRKRMHPREVHRDRQRAADLMR